MATQHSWISCWVAGFLGSLVFSAGAAILAYGFFRSWMIGAVFSISFITSVVGTIVGTLPKQVSGRHIVAAVVASILGFGCALVYFVSLVAV